MPTTSYGIFWSRWSIPENSVGAASGEHNSRKQRLDTEKPLSSLGQTLIRNKSSRMKILTSQLPSSETHD